MIIVRNGVFYVGQKVLIRQWEDMAQEFGTDEDGIPCEGIWFIKTMKRYCGALRKSSDSPKTKSCSAAQSVCIIIIAI